MRIYSIFPLLFCRSILRSLRLPSLLILIQVGLILLVVGLARNAPQYECMETGGRLNTRLHIPTGRTFTTDTIPPPYRAWIADYESKSPDGLRQAFALRGYDDAQKKDIFKLGIVDRRSEIWHDIPSVSPVGGLQWFPDSRYFYMRADLDGKGVKFHIMDANSMQPIFSVDAQPVWASPLDDHSLLYLEFPDSLTEGYRISHVDIPSRSVTYSFSVKGLVGVGGGGDIFLSPNKRHIILWGNIQLGLIDLQKKTLQIFYQPEFTEKGDPIWTYIWMYGWREHDRFFYYRFIHTNPGAFNNNLDEAFDLSYFVYDVDTQQTIQLERLPDELKLPRKYPDRFPNPRNDRYEIVVRPTRSALHVTLLLRDRQTGAERILMTNVPIESVRQDIGGGILERPMLIGCLDASICDQFGIGPSIYTDPPDRLRAIWAEDGSWAFLSLPDRSVWFRMDGSDYHQIVDLPNLSFSAQSGDLKLFRSKVFDQYGYLRDTQIGVFDFKQGTYRVVYHGTYAYASLSPDGKIIAIYRRIDTAAIQDGDFFLTMVRVDGTWLRSALLLGSYNSLYVSGAWSPDSKSFAIYVDNSYQSTHADFFSVFTAEGTQIYTSTTAPKAYRWTRCE